MLKYLIEKEFKQLFRNSFLPKLIFIFPCMIMILMPWAANLEIKNINLNVVDNDHSVLSRRLVDKIGASTYFRLTDLPGTYEEALHAVEEGSADIILEIPRHFERDWMTGTPSSVLIAANAVNGTKGSLGSSYLTTIVNDYMRELAAESPHALQTTGLLPQVRLTTQNLYNPHLNYKLFMIPALMVILLTLMCGFLPSVNVVGEKEAGTIEQINVTPVSKFTFIVGKLIPYWLIGLVVLTVSFFLAWLLYGVVPAGHFLTLYFSALLFLPVISGFGLVISNNSSTMQQAALLMFFFLIIFVLMSGLLTPVSSMPQWAQSLTWLNPLRYYIESLRALYLKGSSVAELQTQLIAMSVYAALSWLGAIMSYRKTE